MISNLTIFELVDYFKIKHTSFFSNYYLKLYKRFCVEWYNKATPYLAKFLFSLKKGKNSRKELHTPFITFANSGFNSINLNNFPNNISFFIVSFRVQLYE